MFFRLLLGLVIIGICAACSSNGIPSDVVQALHDSPIVPDDFEIIRAEHADDWRQTGEIHWCIQLRNNRGNHGFFKVIPWLQRERDGVPWVVLGFNYTNSARAWYEAGCWQNR